MSALFRQKASGIMRDLMAEFDLSIEDAAAVVGNLGHESGGFRFLQEKKPLVPGSRGGWGWAQWTGPRRRQFEAWVAERKLDPSSDAANLGFLIHELRGPERKAIPAVKAARGLRAKVEAFERAFERAGIKHYDGRMRYAEMALAAYEERPTGAKITPAPADAMMFSNEQVRAIQERLRGLGFFEVGKVDGLWGTRTIAAVAAFQAHEGLPVSVGLDPKLDPTTLQRLAIASPRQVAPERANTTAEDLRNQGSATVQRADRIAWAQWAQIAMALLECVVIAWQTYEANPLPFGMSAVLAMAGTPAWLLPIAQFAFAFYTRAKANGVITARLNAERSGMHNGEPDPAPSPPTQYAPEPQQGLPNVSGGWPFRAGGLAGSMGR